MSLVTPTTKDISDNIIAQLEATLGQSIPLLPKSFLRVLSKALAGVFVLLYKYSGFMFLQVFVKTASSADTVVNGVTINPLNFWGELIGVGLPVAATRAEMVIDVTVLTQTGTLPAGTQLVSASNGVTYIILSPVLLDAATVQATIRAAADQGGGGGMGAIGNVQVADVVSFANPLANIARDAVVASLSVTGADAEAISVYRQRVVDRFQKTPQGGAAVDYELWGEEVAGIVNIYPYTSDCPGQVDVYVEATEASSGSADGIPTISQLEAVLASITLDDAGLPSRRPINALVNTFPISRLSFDIAVSGLIVDNLSQVQADITVALTEYMLERAPFIEGLSVLPRFDRVTSSGVIAVVDSIVSAVGGVFNAVTVMQTTFPVDIFSLGIGEKAKLGTLTFN